MVVPEEESDGRAPRWRQVVGGCVVLTALLSVGCIRPASDFPFPRDADTDGDDTGVGEMIADGGDGAAACEPESDAELCSAENACGEVALRDRCGDVRDLECGSCAEGEACVTAGQNVCCQLQPVDQVCDGNYCGVVTITDPDCGTEREVDCSGFSCPGDDCMNGVCGPCEPKSDETLCEEAKTIECGTAMIANGCNETVSVDCGECPFDDQVCESFDDGRTECDCNRAEKELDCDDGDSEDCDGLVDCEDPDCAEQKCDDGLLPVESDDKYCVQGECR